MGCLAGAALLLQDNADKALLRWNGNPPRRSSSKALPLQSLSGRVRNVRAWHCDLLVRHVRGVGKIATGLTRLDVVGKGRSVCQSGP